MTETLARMRLPWGVPRSAGRCGRIASTRLLRGGWEGGRAAEGWVGGCL